MSSFLDEMVLLTASRELGTPWWQGDGQVSQWVKGAPVEIVIWGPAL
jgi:hypothetical protein